MKDTNTVQLLNYRNKISALGELRISKFWSCTVSINPLVLHSIPKSIDTSGLQNYLHQLLASGFVIGVAFSLLVSVFIRILWKLYLFHRYFQDLIRFNLHMYGLLLKINKNYGIFHTPLLFVTSNLI